MHASTTPSLTSGPGERRPFRLEGPDHRPLLILVGFGIIGLLVAGAILPTMAHGPFRAATGEATLFGATVAAGVVLVVLARNRASWRGTRWAAGVLAMSWALQVAGWIARVLTGVPPVGDLFVGSMTVLLVLFLGALVVDFFDHVHTGRAEVLSDVALVATLFGAAVFLLLRGEGGAIPESTAGSLLTGTLALLAILLMAGWGVLELWCPTRVHLGIFGAATLLSGSAIALTYARQSHWDPGLLVGPEVAAGISILFLAGILVVEPRLNEAPPRNPRVSSWVRPTMLGLALCAAAVMVVAELISTRVGHPLSHSVLLAVLVFGSVGVRMLLNHVEMTRVTRAMSRALDDREAALASLRLVSDEIAASEARHRLLLESAVDGIVELDSRATVVRANDAFCGMVRLSANQVVGRRWIEVARAAGAGESLERLPETGEATLERADGPAYLEARSSMLPTMPSGRLLLIRDVTASKTAEQTIRTLFHYLQDRDEDRSQLLARSSSAVEAERNRIARDLHDGPIQGVSAAAISLEAARMLVERGEATRAADVLHDIGQELAEEAVNLRRIMSDLRPPVLEERGLIPAVRELCARLRRELRIPVTVVGTPGTEVPREIETLAYRIVQEAVSNAGKHASATEVEVRISSTAGTLAVEVSDDGQGFEPEQGREFLKGGKVGLASMRERTELAGGTFAIRSGPGSGTTISATIPFEVLGSVPSRP